MRVLSSYKSGAVRACPWLTLILVVLMPLAGALVPAVASGRASPDRTAVSAQGSAENSPPAQATPGPTDDRSRYSRGDSNVIFKWDMLVDALALVVARAWLCCGVLVVLAIPILFLVLWNKSRPRPQP